MEDLTLGAFSTVDLIDEAHRRNWEEEVSLLARLQAGETVVVHETRNALAVQWAKDQDLYVYVGRPFRGRRGPWGNPFKVGRDGTLPEVLEKYRGYLEARPDLLAAVPSLRGRLLSCWCHPAPCHGDILRELAEASVHNGINGSNGNVAANGSNGINGSNGNVSRETPCETE